MRRRPPSPADAPPGGTRGPGRLVRAEDVYVYFNNDPGGAAVVNSADFAALTRDAGLTMTRTPPADGVAPTAAVPTW